MKAAGRRIALALLAALSAAPTVARASGLYLLDRGVRPLARGGAFVAGADDGHAIWYNPAGLAFAGNGVLLDMSYIGYGESFHRQSFATYGTPPVASGPIDHPTVRGTAAPLPVPTLVVTHDLGVRNWMFAAGLFAPNSVITSYADTPLAPQRYSLVTLDGSVLVVGGLWAAYRHGDTFSAGLGVQALMGSFNSRKVLSGCPATLTCQPENPDWDSVADLRVGPIFAPSANAGVRWQPNPYLVLGLSAQLPFWVNAPATMGVRLPSHPYFDGAAVRGNRGEVSFTLPPVVRAGVEVRPDPRDRVEVAIVYEAWSVHDRILLRPTVDASQPNGIQITNVTGVGTYDIGPVTIDRHFRDSVSVRVGFERDQAIGTSAHLHPRVGFSYDTSATTPEYTSVLTLDSNKFIAALGAGLTFGHWRVDVTYAHAFVSTVTVAPTDARLYQLQPFRANSMAPTDAINGGTYTMSLDVVGVGANYRF